MALSGTADPIEAEYSVQDFESSPLRVCLHLDAVDGIARDVVEGFKALPRRGVEVGGLLLGHVEPGERPVVWIDRYQRIECGHRFGPQFVLDEEEHAALDRAAGSISAGSELSVVGFYRSHTRPGFQLEDADFEFVSRYFSDPSDILLLIKPENMIEISAQFFARGATGEIVPAGPVFPFRGHVVGPIGGPMTGMDEEIPVEPPEAPTAVEQPPAPAAPRELKRRLVPDFAPSEEPARPAREFFMEQRPARPPDLHLTHDSEGAGVGAFVRRWWPVFGALVLVGGAVWFLLQSQPSQRESATGPTVAETNPSNRPLGLYVDGSGQSWRVSWNPSATALRGARNVEMFVRDGEEQNRIDLTPQDLASGTYQYQPKTQDVTFRLEAAGSNGQLSAESFRLMKTSPPVAVKPAAPPVRDASRNTTPPRAVHKVPPVVPASIRPRIRGSMPIDVRVHVDARGRVTSAVPVKKPQAGLESFLAEKAIYAAKLWRFEPARQNGTAVAGVETIHFVFER